MPFKNDFDIERSIEPPDEQVPDVECVICEVKVDYDDSIEIHGKYICIWCAGKIRNLR